MGCLMIDVTPNISAVVAEVRELFERYEQALVDKNVDVLPGSRMEGHRRARLDDEPVTGDMIDRVIDF